MTSAMPTGPGGTNWINMMQEWLQRHCPIAQSQRLWRDESERVGEQRFRVRVILINTGPTGDQDLPMPWSRVTCPKVDAKKDAARLCLARLLEMDTFPHDPSQVRHAVGVAAASSGGGAANGAASSSSMAGTTLPDLTDLLAVDPVIMTPVLSSTYANAARVANDVEEEEVAVVDKDDGDDDDDDDGDEAVWSSSTTAPPAQATTSTAPPNLGALGEEYALCWLRAQPWVVAASVTSENVLGGEQAATRDIACVPTASPGRRHIEVKTRWRSFGKLKASAAQRARLIDPDDDYLLMVIGAFENLLPTDGRAPSPPRVRLLPNVKRGEAKAEGQAADGQPAEGQPAEGQVAEGQVAEGQVAEGQVAEGQVADRQVAEGQALRAELARHSPGSTLLVHSRGLYDGSSVLVFVATAVERLRSTLDPHADNRARGKAASLGAEHVDAIEASDLCSQLLKGNPRWCSLLVAGAAAPQTAFASGAFAELLEQPKLLLGGAFARACAHQAHGMVRALRKAAEAEGRPPWPPNTEGGGVVSAAAAGRGRADEWRERLAVVSKLLQLSAAAHVGASARPLPVPAPSDVTAAASELEWVCDFELGRPASERRAADSSSGLGRLLSMCEAHVVRANAAYKAEAASALRDEAEAFLEEWLRRHAPPEVAARDGALPDGASQGLPPPPRISGARRPSEPRAEDPPPLAEPSASFGELLATLGSPRPPSEIIHAVQCGSKMYNLATASSDADFHLVYLSASSSLLTLRERVAPAKLHFSRSVAAPYGAAKDGVVEFTCVELAHYTHTLSRGNPSAVELLYVPEAQRLRAQWPWCELLEGRAVFLTETAFQQYVGFVKVHLGRARSCLAEAELRAFSKAMYHTFHKLYEARRILSGEGLHVALRGAEHDHVLRLRTRPLEDELAPEAVLADAEAALTELLADHAVHAERARQGLVPPLKSAPEASALNAWLHTVRVRALRRERGTSGPLPPLPSRQGSSASSGRSRDEALAAAAELTRDIEQGAAGEANDAAARSAAASAAANRAAVGEAVSEEDWQRVCEALEQLEAQEGVRVLFASERSSRSFGTQRADSDLDVLAVFALPLEEMLSSRPVRKALKLSLGGGEGPTELTVSALEARHACTLLATSNPTMYEALRSPLVYRAEAGWLREARGLLDEHCDAAGLQRAYVHLARQDYNREMLRRGEKPHDDARVVLGKKYMHIVREVSTALWLLRAPADSDRGAAPWPPLRVAELVAADWMEASIRSVVGRMLSAAERPSLGTPRPPEAELEAWIRQKLAVLKQREPSGPPPRKTEAEVARAARAAEAWDGFCVRTLMEVCRASLR